METKSKVGMANRKAQMYSCTHYMMCAILDDPNTLKGGSWKAHTVVESLERLEKGGHTQSLMAAPSVSVPVRMGI